MDEVYAFLKEVAPTYFLGTIENGKPRLRPFGTVDIFEGKLYIQMGKCKPVYKQLIENPSAEICACKGFDWLRVSGELVEDDRVEAKKHMLDAYPHLRKFYDENDDNTIVFYFKNAHAKFEYADERPTYEVSW